MACAGHRVGAHALTSLLTEPTNAVTMLRHPWDRLQSDMHYFIQKPSTQHLAPELNSSVLLTTTISSPGLLRYTVICNETFAGDSVCSVRYPAAAIYDYIRVPGVNNCMTKMLNGFQCAQLVSPPPGVDHELYWSRLLINAKNALQAMAFVGITEHFRSSLCLFAFMYGGEPTHTVTRERAGQYNAVRRPDSRQVSGEPVDLDQWEHFKDVEKWDLELYDYALNNLFLPRLLLANIKVF
jgi:hypothetical protein